MVYTYMYVYVSQVDLSGSGLRGNEGSMINNYTLTMDICLDSAPDNPLSLLQTLGIGINPCIL